MKTTVNLKPALVYLDDLAKNNNKPWFDANRERYGRVRQDFIDFVQQLIADIDRFDPLGILSAQACVFRINRDLRFSKDKTPYKTNFSASIAPGGKKSTRQSYYFQLMPHNQSGIAGGLYMPPTEQIQKFRQAIARDAAPLKKIINAKPFVRTFGVLADEKLKSAPKGYTPDHPEIELLKLKQITFWHPFTDADVTSPQFPRELAQTCKTLKPFLRYLDTVLT